MSFIARHDGPSRALVSAPQSAVLPMPITPAPATGEALSIDFRSLFQAILRRKLWVLVPLLMTTLLGAAYISTLRPRFSSSVQILVDPRELQIIRSDAPLRQQMPDNSGTLAENTIVILRSSAILMKLVERENLAVDPEFVGSKDSGMTPEARRLAALRTLERRVTVKRADRSSIIEAAIWTENAEKSANLANALAAIFLEQQQGAESDTARKAAQSVAARLDELGQRVQKAEREVEEYKARNNLQMANGKLVGEQQLQELNSQLVLARARASEARSKFDSIRKLSLAAIERGELPDASNSSVISQLRLKYAEASRLEAEARTRLGARHPDMVSITAQVRDARQLILDELSRISRAAQGDYERAKAAEDALAKSLDQLRNQSSDTGDALVRLRELERQADASRTIYSAFLRRTRELNEQEDIATINARVISPATPAQRPSGPSRALIGLGSVMVGGILGLLLAVLAEQFDATLRNRRQFQQASGLPVLGEFPRRGRSRSGGLNAPVLDAPRDPFAISAFRLADLFAAEALPDRARSVLFLSVAAPATEVVLNVAIATAQATWRVLLVDADSSGNGLTGHLDVDAAHGLADVLDQQCDLSGAVLTDDRTSLRILANGARGRLRSSRPSPQQIEKSLLVPANAYELVFIDGGTIGADAAAYALAAVVDDIVLVAGAGQASASQIRDALDLIGPFRDRLRGIVTV